MRPTSVQIIAIALCVALLGASSLNMSSINERRKSLNMIGSESPLENAPPEYALAIQALGAFRGLITNIAFIRAEEYKMAGRYYDAYDLADWICKLQPRFPSVWEFQSWNMAWNISVTTYTPEERWHWVYSGATLIRDEGLKYNPRAVNLYRQLAWIFVNKMSESIDEYHMTYKREWAWRMHLVLGNPPNPLGSFKPGESFKTIDEHIGDDKLAQAAKIEARRWAEKRGESDRVGEVIERATSNDTGDELSTFEIAKKAAYDRLKEIADAPTTLADLYKQTPETKAMVRALAKMGVRINDDELIEKKYDHGLAMSFFYRVRVLSDPPSLLGQVLVKPNEDDDVGAIERFDKIVGVREKRPAGTALVRFMQKKVLHDVYKLEASKMAELTALFGPIDWRVVDSQSLYWINEGLIAGGDTITRFGNDKINAARLIFFSLRNLFNRNKVIFEPYTKDINLSYLNFNPDLNFIEPMHQAFLTYGAMLDPDADRKGTGQTFKTGHVNFLIEAIRTLYVSGREREAAHYYEYLRKTYGRQPDGSANPRYIVPLGDFVTNSLYEDPNGYRDIRLALNAMLRNAYTRLAAGDLTRFDALMRRTRELYRNYSKDRSDMDKLRLPPFRAMQSDVLYTILHEPSAAPGVTLLKARLWRKLPLDLRQEAYDKAVGELKEECDAVGFVLAKTFPEPEGMEQFRIERGRRGAKKEKKSADTPAQQIE